MSKRFLRIHIEITDFCGLACHFCTPRKNQRGVMPLALFRRAVAECAPYTDVVALHLLGDPLCVDSLEVYLEVVREAGLRAEITTSGFYLANQEALFHPAIKQLNISLTSYFSNAKRLSLDEYWGRVVAFLEARKARGGAEFVNLRLWNRSHEPRNSELIERIEASFGCRIDPKLKRQRLDFKIILDLDELFSWSEAEARLEGRCLALQTHAGILSDGTIVPCCLDAGGALALGNLKEIALEEALTSPRARAIKEGFAKGRRIEPFCQRCGYPSHLERNRRA